jgi:predicted dehydrogenase
MAAALKVAIVGCGKIADGHVEQIQRMPQRARVVAACDRELLMAEQLATRYAIPAHYDDFARLLTRDKPDVVHIATPPASHLALVEQAVDAGCHVYVEKPLALDAANAAAMIEVVERAGRKLTVGYTYLFDPPAVALRELVAEGVLGDVVHVESSYGYDLRGPFGAALLADGDHWVHRLPGQLLHNNIDHLLNKIAEFVVDDAPELCARGRRLHPQRYGDERDRMLDELRLLVSGSQVTAYGTFSAAIRPGAHSLRVLGTKDSVTADFTARTLSFPARPRLPSAIGRLLPPFQQAAELLRSGLSNVVRFARADFQFFAGLEQLIARYYDSILDGAALPIPYRDMLRISRWMDSIFAELESQRPALERQQEQPHEEQRRAHPAAPKKAGVA